MAQGVLNYGGDQPSTGALQDHFIAEVFKPAMTRSVLANYAKKIMTEGNSFSIPSFETLELPSSIDRSDELSAFGVDKLVLDGRVINHVLRGRAMEITETMVNRNRNVYDIISIAREQLSQQMQRGIERIVKEAMDDTPIDVVFTGLASQSVTTTGTPTASATNNLNVYQCQYLSLLMRDTYAVPVLPELGAYAGVFRGDAFLSLRNDARWDAYYEGVPAGLRGFLVGQVADIALFHQDDEEILSNSLGTNSDVSEGLVFGQDACWFGMVSPFQFYEDMGQVAANDFGTKKYLWYKADAAAAIPSTSTNKRRVRVAHITSA